MTLDPTLPPAADELEVSIFGPGFGEAIAVHFGDGKWMLVDSCWLDRVQQVPVTRDYLDSIGVPANQVKQIVASHWHDDHVSGLSRLIERYTDAEISLPSYLSLDEGREFLLAYAGVVERSTRGTRELYRSMTLARDSGRRLRPIMQRSLLVEEQTSIGLVRAVALSPTSAAWAKGLGSLFSRVAPGTIPRNVAEPKPNISSIVLHIDFDGEAVVLGSDLETDGELGWGAVLADEWSMRRPKASLYKVAHHGSPTACFPPVWRGLMKTNPAAGLTPFINGKVRLPEDEDLTRIVGHLGSGTLHATSMPGKNLPKGTAAERLLPSFLKNATGRSARMGQLRYRKRRGDASWTCHMSDAARSLKAP